MILGELLYTESWKFRAERFVSEMDCRQVCGAPAPVVELCSCHSRYNRQENSWLFQIRVYNKSAWQDGGINRRFMRCDENVAYLIRYAGGHRFFSLCSHHHPVHPIDGSITEYPYYKVPHQCSFHHTSSNPHATNSQGKQCHISKVRSQKGSTAVKSF